MAGGNLYLYQPLTVGILEVIDAVNLQDQTGGAAPLDVAGDLTLGADVNGSGFISLVGSGNQTITSSAAAYLTNLNVANAGNVDLPTPLVLYNGNLTGTGAFVGTVQFGIGNSQSYGVTFAGSMPDAVLNMNGGNLYFYQPLNVGTLEVIDSVNLQDQTGGSAPLDVTGDLTIDAPIQGSGFISLVGSGDQSITSSAAGYLTNLNVANGGNVDLPTTLVLYNGTLTGTGTFVGSVQFGTGNGQSYSNYFTGSIPDVVLNMAGGNLYPLPAAHCRYTGSDQLGQPARPNGRLRSTRRDGRPDDQRHRPGQRLHQPGGQRRSVDYLLGRGVFDQSERRQRGQLWTSPRPWSFTTATSPATARSSARPCNSASITAKAISSLSPAPCPMWS